MFFRKHHRFKFFSKIRTIEIDFILDIIIVILHVKMLNFIWVLWFVIRIQMSPVCQIMQIGEVIQALQQEAGEILGKSHAGKKIVENQLQLLFPIKDLSLIQGVVSERFIQPF